MKHLLILFLSSLLFSAPLFAAEHMSKAELQELKAEYKRPAEIPFPEDNQYSKAKYDLGKALYFDPRLSASGTQSCATCHNPSFHWGDGMARGVGHGHKKLGRKSPTVLNMAFRENFMWDGRAETLEIQATGPIEADVEMNMDMATALNRLNAIPGYQKMFTLAFPGEKAPISKTNLAKAIATFERMIVSEKAPFDRWIEGDENAISASAKRGFELFNGKARCAVCHSEWYFTDDSFHDIGLASKDIGRGKFDNKRVLMQHAFKTVGLRNIAERGPYMHDGSIKTLMGVIDHYDHGFIQRPSLSKDIKPLNLTKQEKMDLVAFLRTLTSKDKPVTLPVLPPNKH